MFRDDPDPFSEWWSMMVFVNMAGNTWKWKPSSDANSGNIFIEWIRCAGGLGGGGTYPKSWQALPMHTNPTIFQILFGWPPLYPPPGYMYVLLFVLYVFHRGVASRGVSCSKFFFFKFTYQKVNWSAIFPLFRHQLIGLKYKTN